jgi:vacuole morphology and inheritance protein 14
MVKEFIANKDVAMIKRLTSVLRTEFSVSHNPHSRKGGLIGLAATAIALGKVINLLGINDLLLDCY